MARNQTVNRPSSNLFALNRLRNDCYYQPVRVDFSPIQKPNQLFEPIIPYFNKDCHYFTPAFILPRDKISDKENLKTEKNKFQARIIHSQGQTQEKTPQYNPTDNRFCQLCQEVFEDYWEHINGKYHKRQINSSKFNKDIVALCENIQKHQLITNLAKTKGIQKRKRSAKNTIGTKDLKQPRNKLNTLATDKQGCDQKQENKCCRMEEDKVEQRLRKNVEQSLKITLQLNNHSTNLLSNNPFKEIYKNP